MTAQKVEVPQQNLEVTPYGFAVPPDKPWLGPFMRLIADYLITCDEALERWRKEHPRNRSKAAALVHNGTMRARSATRSGHILLGFDRYEDAVVHARTVVEWAILLAFVTQELEVAEAKARRLAAFHTGVSRYESILSARELGHPEATDARLRQRQRAYERLDRMYYFPGDSPRAKKPFWDPDDPRRRLTTAKMARLVGLRSAYATTYAYGSDQVHASVMSVAQMMKPIPEDAARTAVSFTLQFDRVLRIADGFLKLGHEEELSALFERGNALVRRLQAGDPELTV
jgi:hypothetical protein